MAADVAVQDTAIAAAIAAANITAVSLLGVQDSIAILAASPASCFLFGDVHPTSFDGLHFDFQAVGVFWLLRRPGPLYTSYGPSGFSMQAHLQPLTQYLPPGSAAAINHVGVIHMAGIALRAGPYCGVITITPLFSQSSITPSWFDIVDDGVHVSVPYVAAAAGEFASAISYQLSCATVYLPASNVAVITSFNGYTVTLTAYTGSGRFSNLAVSVPSSALNHTEGLCGSWNGNQADDFVDQTGIDWRLLYPGSVDAAVYPFGLTWTVEPVYSYFADIDIPPAIGCDAVSDRPLNFSLGYLFAGQSGASKPSSPPSTSAASSSSTTQPASQHCRQCGSTQRCRPMPPQCARPSLAQ